MHKLAITMLGLLPFAVSAQQAPLAPPQRSLEIGVNALAGAYRVLGDGYTEAYGGASVRILRNNNRFQYGLAIDATTFTAANWALSPALLANYRALGKEGYWYAGATAGYMKVTPWPQSPNPFARMSTQGYMFGLQAGFVKALNRRLSFNAELAVRSTQTWEQYEAITLEPMPTYSCISYTYTFSRLTARVYVPVSAGLRYRF